MMSTGPKAIIIGGKGMLGFDLMAALERDGTYAPAIVGDLPEVDITRMNSLREFFGDARPEIIFNCAAYTDVDGCESKRDVAFSVNGLGAGNVAEMATTLGARLIHISTDFVFDGKKASPYCEDDPPGPLSAYAESKLQGEQQVMARGGNWLIARTAWLYGAHGRNFVDLMLRLAKEKAELSVVTDQVGSPTWTYDLAEALIALAKHGAQGVFHTANTGSCSRYEQVQLIVECARLATRILPVDSSAFPRSATVPPYSPLNMEKLRRETGHTMRPWRDALAAYLLSRKL